MARVVWLAALLCFLPARSFAESWSGALLDSRCYESAERNVNPTDTLTSVDRDEYDEVRSCSPGKKTKAFLLLQRDGTTFKLDPDGNAKAAELVRTTGRKPLLLVRVTGEVTGKAIKVASISQTQ